MKPPGRDSRCSHLKKCAYKTAMMIQPLPLPIQTMYAELVDRAVVSELQARFPAEGSFYKRTVKGRNYWYFQTPQRDRKRKQQYVGPETEELNRTIEEHRQYKDAAKERRDITTALLAVDGIQAPDNITGRVLDALSRAGVFQLRAVVIGTTAYQCYGPMLGIKLPSSALRTADLDIAQFPSVSLAIDDQIDQPFDEILRSVDPRFRPVPHIHDRARVTQYDLNNRFRVDLLAPNEGPDTDEPMKLPALAADAQPLRYLDYLIYQEVKAVALWGAGVLINVPAPERFACHKLIVSEVRAESATSQTKARKDLEQASNLLEVLAEQRPSKLVAAWRELIDRGPRWRAHGSAAFSKLPQQLQDTLMDCGFKP